MVFAVLKRGLRRGVGVGECRGGGGSVVGGGGVEMDCFLVVKEEGVRRNAGGPFHAPTGEAEL